VYRRLLRVFPIIVRGDEIAVAPVTMKPPMSTSFPLWTKPRVEKLTGREAGVSYSSAVARTTLLPTPAAMSTLPLESSVAV
jgi:hypothetical protein